MQSGTMNCCPTAEFTLLDNGLQVRELMIQDDTAVTQFFPYRAIQSVRFTNSRNERESQITIWIHAHGTPGAGGLSFRWRLCQDAGQAKYEELIARIP
jgi:hypothetical protein